MRSIFPAESEPADTRERIVRASRDLFHRKGFHRTSLVEICEEAGVNTGSLYYFFKTKDALLEAALTRNAEVLGPWIMEPAFATTTDPIERVFAVLDRYRALLEASDFALGCPIGALALELHDPAAGIRDGLELAFDDWCGWMTACFEEAGDRLPASASRQALARFVMVVMEGAVLHARGTRSLEGFDVAVRHLRDHIELLEARAGTASSAGREDGS